MNVGRGLFRAWILFSSLWALGAGFMAYVIVAPTTLHGSFQPTVLMKKSATAGQVEKIDFSKPFYDFGVSPSQSHSTMEFSADTISPAVRSQFDQIEFPDGSRLYLPAGYSGADKNYISSQVWGQRWSRWGDAGAMIAAWAFGPCILLFVLGYSLLWVGRGFKRDAAA
ncbi:MAG: hypothetical protein JO141_21200 [Bradyrhizobium sp.]|nr:hypothetical protein [Bradyrhizobium sp.]